MSMDDQWQPTASAESLEQRAVMLATARKYFATEKVLEVETPVLGKFAVTDPHTDSLSIQLNENQAWLRTSPEYHMKRLLADHPRDIYQIGKVFRAGEAGSKHQPEFTMIEWYRLGFSYQEIINDVCKLIQLLSKNCALPISDHSSLTYRDAFRQHCELDPLTASVQELRFCADKRMQEGLDSALAVALGDNKNSWLDLLASHFVWPALKPDTLQVITDYPASQAMLAQTVAHEANVAERFEVFFNGVELANGYVELRDPVEQRQRFTADNQMRTTLGKPTLGLDTDLLLALEHGLPPCAGVALGLDRVLMVTEGFDSINATLSFVPGQ
jgi:lysyl-tRNA synthetase class 2